MINYTFVRWATVITPYLYTFHSISKILNNICNTLTCLAMICRWKVRSSLSLSHISLEGDCVQSIVDAVLLMSSADILSHSSTESSRITMSGVDLLDVVTSKLVDGGSVVNTADELSLLICKLKIYLNMLCEQAHVIYLLQQWVVHKITLKLK